MTEQNYRFLLSQQRTLRNLLAKTSPGNVLGRMSLERRLQEVETELQSYEGFAVDCQSGGPGG